MTEIDTRYNVGGSLIGNAKKAVLIIKKFPSSGSSGDPKTLAAKALSAGTAGKPDGAMENQRLEVQYNPSSLTIKATAKPIPFSPLMKSGGTDTPTQDTAPPSLDLSVQLTFDDVNVRSAFFADKYRASVSHYAADIAFLDRLSKDKHYSVQPQTNGLLTLLMRPETQYVTFQWAELAFTGLVTKVDAKYTMFSQEGRPIRSTVTLSLTWEMDKKVAHAYWGKCFDACFKDTLSGSGWTDSILGGKGGLLNISGL